MQDLKALEGKSLAELREIGKALGIPHLMMKKKDLIEKILNFTQDGGHYQRRFCGRNRR